MKEKFMNGLGTTLGVLTLCGVSGVVGFVLGIYTIETTNKDLEKEVAVKNERIGDLSKENIALKTELEIMRNL